MTIKINAQGAERKRLVLTIAKWMGDPAEYRGAPTFRYKVGGIIVDKDGTTTFPEELAAETTERLLQHLYDEGFDLDMRTEEDNEPTGICISMPRSLFTEASIANLYGIVDAKGSLIKKALGVAELPILIEDTDIEGTAGFQRARRGVGIIPHFLRDPGNQQGLFPADGRHSVQRPADGCDRNTARISNVF